MSTASKIEQFNEFLKGYIECIDFTEEETLRVGEEPIDVVEALSHEALARIYSDCVDFFFNEYRRLQLIISYSYTYGHAGHDFWLTRNGHGAGFWDRGFKEDGEELADHARIYCAVEVYCEYDGKVHLG